MNNKAKVGIVVLAVICIGQAFAIYHLLKAEKEPLADMDDFSTHVFESFKQNQKKQWDDFDRFFDDRFFKREHDPFQAMERFKERAKRMMEDSFRGQFDQSWNSWFDSRFGNDSAQIGINQEEEGDHYVITLTVKELDDHDLKIDIDADGISISGSYSKTVEKKDESGRVVSRQERRESLSRKFAIPEDADYKKADIQKEKDRVVIKLPKK